MSRFFEGCGNKNAFESYAKYSKGKLIVDGFEFFETFQGENRSPNWFV